MEGSGLGRAVPHLTRVGGGWGGVEGVLPTFEWVVSRGRVIKWPERTSTGLAH